jgi:ABC-type transport system involved in multi-copper enzyme maturation permease subunit
MNRALIVKTLRDYGPLFALVLLVMIVFPMLLILALSSTPTEMIANLIKIDLIREFLRLLIGEDPVGMLSRTGYAGFAFVHPVMQAVSWAFLVVVTTGVLAGEIDRGTADLTMSLPISRWGIYSSVSVVLLCFIPLMALSPTVGAAILESIRPDDDPIDIAKLPLISVNGAAMYLGIAGICLAFSAAMSRRGTAVGYLFAWLLLSFLINVLGALWEAAENWAVISFVYYFRPMNIVRDDQLDPVNMIVLLTMGITGWLAGGFIFAKRDIRTT